MYNSSRNYLKQLSVHRVPQDEIKLNEKIEAEQEKNNNKVLEESAYHNIV